MGRKNYSSFDDLLDDLDKDSLINDETDLLDDEDLALLHGPTAPTPSPVKAVKKSKKPSAKKKKRVK